MTSSSGASSPLTSDPDENKALCKYMTKLGKSGEGGVGDGVRIIISNATFALKFSSGHI